MCCWCEIRKIRILCSCVFELCVGSTRFRVEAADVHNAQVLAMRLFSQKFFYQKLRLNVFFLVDVSGSFGLFVGQCVASLETSVMSSSRTPLSQSDVTRSSLVYSCEVSVRYQSGKCNRTLAHCQDPFSHFGCSSDFL